MPVIPQPISSGPGAALPAICDGSAKIPLPIIEPTTIAVSAESPSLTGAAADGRDCVTTSDSTMDCSAPIAMAICTGRSPHFAP